MIDATTLVILTTFLLAGLVKGVIGLGLPTVSLAILTVALDLPSAMVLLLVPSFQYFLITNFLSLRISCPRCAIDVSGAACVKYCSSFALCAIHRHFAAWKQVLTMRTFSVKNPSSP